MTRLVLVLVVILAWAGGAVAQTGPQVEVDLEATETVVGQPLTLRITVLVPTWMPTAPEFPSLDAPGLLVRLPERASGPVSERIEGETWSGVQRAYRLYPLQSGDFAIPGQTVAITYADPETTDPITLSIDLDPIGFRATVPQGAEGLDPMIIASGFSIEAAVEVPSDLAVGGAVQRTLQARIAGTTPILIPALTPADAVTGLRPYSDEPRITETEDRGVLSGTRTERTTYLATADGAAELPAVSIRWFNLETGSVETASVEAVALTIAPDAALSKRGLRLDWTDVLKWAAALAFVAFALRAVRAPLSAFLERLRLRRNASERHAHRRVLSAIRQRDLGGVLAALGTWSGFYPHAVHDDVTAALADVGRARYSGGEQAAQAQAWSRVAQSYASMRRTARRAGKTGTAGAALPSLNPDWQQGGTR